MIAPAALRDGLQEQMRVFHALLLREIRTRFGKHRIGYAWAVVEPSMHVAALYGMRILLGGVAPQHIPILLWLISGIVPMFLFRGVFTRTVASVSGNKDLLMLPQVTTLDIIWARALLEFMTYGFIIVVLFGLYASLIGPVEVSDPLRILWCLFILMLLGIGMGMIMLAATSFFPSTQALVGGIMRVLYVISGVFYSPSRLPAEMHPYLHWNPLLHVFENLHAAFFASYVPMPGTEDLGYPLACSVLCLFMGMTLIQRARRFILGG